MNAREQWVWQYREARKVRRFERRFRDKLEAATGHTILLSATHTTAHAARVATFRNRDILGMGLFRAGMVSRISFKAVRA